MSKKRNYSFSTFIQDLQDNWENWKMINREFKYMVMYKLKALDAAHIPSMPSYQSKGQKIGSGYQFLNNNMSWYQDNKSYLNSSSHSFDVLEITNLISLLGQAGADPNRSEAFREIFKEATIALKSFDYTSTIQSVPFDNTMGIKNIVKAMKQKLRKEEKRIKVYNEAIERSKKGCHGYLYIDPLTGHKKTLKEALILQLERNRDRGIALRENGEADSRLKKYGWKCLCKFRDRHQCWPVEL